MDRLTDFTTLTAASRLVGVTVQTLRAWVDRGLVRAVRDDAGRHLLLRVDVERIVRERLAHSGHSRRHSRADS